LSYRVSQANDNRSLTRGLQILRAFRPGLDALTNSELAQRCDLPKSTVSRLTGTLVRTGYLLHDPHSGTYRLGPTVLGMAHVMRSSSFVLNESLALMQTVGRQIRVNIGLALPDHDDMIYLENLPFGPKASLRRIVAGQRVPMALTGLGRAYLSTLDEQALLEQFEHLKLRYARDWPIIEAHIRHDIAAVREQGYCAVAWQPSVASIAVPLVLPNEPVHSINMSLFTDQDLAQVAQTLAPALLRLRQLMVTRLVRRRQQLNALASQ
jgi:DNA-binding IclR family transcriptional regulator